VIVRAQQAQRAGVPVHGVGRRRAPGRPGRLAQQRDRRLVADERRTLDVVRARRGGRAAQLERGGGALMGDEPPARRRAIVDGPADERMAERERPAVPGG
jgi:hypothetical protein